MFNKKYEPITLRGFVSPPDSFSRNWANSMNRHGSQRILYTGGAFIPNNFKENPPIDDYEGKQGLRKIFASSSQLHSSPEPKLKWTKSKSKGKKKKWKLILPPAPIDSSSRNFFTNNIKSNAEKVKMMEVVMDKLLSKLVERRWTRRNREIKMKEARTALKLNKEFSRQSRFNSQMQDKMTVATASGRLSL